MCHRLTYLDPANLAKNALKASIEQVENVHGLPLYSSSSVKRAIIGAIIFASSALHASAEPDPSWGAPKLEKEFLQIEMVPAKHLLCNTKFQFSDTYITGICCILIDQDLPYSLTIYAVGMTKQHGGFLTYAIYYRSEIITSN